MLPITRGDAGRVAGVFYFVSFYIVTVLILVNILTSLVMEMFGLTWRVQSRRAAEEEEEGGEGGATGGEQVRSVFVTVAGDDVGGGGGGGGGGGDRWMVTRSNDWAKARPFHRGVCDPGGIPGVGGGTLKIPKPNYLAVPKHPNNLTAHPKPP